MRTTSWILGGLLLLGGVATAGEVAPSAEQVRPLLIGAQVPEAALRDADGEVFDLRAAMKKKPTILIFYRGGW